MRVQSRPVGMIQSLGPVLAIIASALLIILGIVIIIFPVILAWVVGIGLILAGVGVFTTAVTATAGGTR